MFQSPYLEGLAPIPLRRGHTGAHLADGSFLPYAYYLAVKLFINEQPMYHVFIVCNRLSSPIILGKDFLKAHKAVISYLNHTVQFNHNPVMLAQSTALIAPNHTGILTVTLPAYLRKDQLICMQPGIPKLQVTDSIVQMQYTGKYQIAKLLVKNESGSPCKIFKNQILGVFDFVRPEYLHEDPVYKIMQTTAPNTEIDSKSEQTSPILDQEGYQGSDNCATLNAQTNGKNSKIRPLEFFQDSSIDIEQFEQLTKDYDFDKLEPSENLSQDTIDKLKYVILKNLKAFYLPGSRIQKVNDYEVTLQLQPDNNKPWKQSFYPIPKDQKEQVQKQVELMQKQGIITPISQTPKDVRLSPYSSPCMILKKPGSETELRLVSDVRELNKRLLPFPPQDTLSVEQSLIQIANMPLNSISQLDVSHAYFQLGLARNSWQYSVVSIGSQKYLIDRMIMGAASSASIWTFYMVKILNNLYYHSVISYLDDLYLASESPDKHLKLLNELFSRCIKTGIQFKASKSLFFQDHITYLGQTISKDRTVRPKQSKVDTLIKLSLPHNLRTLRRFLGMMNFFKTYIPDLATTANPLYKLLQGRKKVGKIVLNPTHVEAIKKLKNIMASKPVLNLADYSKQFHLITHANPIGLTGTLFQMEEINGKFHTRIIAHSSKTLNPTQQRYNPSILEILAVVSSLSTFQQILNNALVNVITDNPTTQRVLQATDSLTKPNASRIQKWIVIIETFQVRLFLFTKANETQVGDDQKPLTNTNTLTPNKIGELYTDKAVTTPRKIMETNKAKPQKPDSHINTNPEQPAKTPDKISINEITQEQHPLSTTASIIESQTNEPEQAPPTPEITETKQKKKRKPRKKKKKSQTDNTSETQTMDTDSNNQTDRQDLDYYDSDLEDNNTDKQPVMDQWAAAARHMPAHLLERQRRWKRKWAAHVAKQPEEEQQYMFQTTMY